VIGVPIPASSETKRQTKEPAVKVLSADFVLSASKLSQAPSDELPEVAFFGRSNVGKSTMINSLLGRRKLARVSRTPGRTRLLNFFRVRARTVAGPPVEFMLCDLPGYGYAKAAKEETRGFREMIEGYLAGRVQLKGAVALLDIRREPSDLDLALFEWLQKHDKNVIPVVTKADKLSRSRQGEAVRGIERVLDVPARDALPFSAVTGQGRDELWNQLLVLFAG
jgi:GTP-binding protein